MLNSYTTRTLGLFFVIILSLFSEFSAANSYLGCNDPDNRLYAQDAGQVLSQYIDSYKREGIREGAHGSCSTYYAFRYIAISFSSLKQGQVETYHDSVALIRKSLYRLAPSFFTKAPGGQARDSISLAKVEQRISNLNDREVQVVVKGLLRLADLMQNRWVDLNLSYLLEQDAKEMAYSIGAYSGGALGVGAATAVTFRYTNLLSAMMAGYGGVAANVVRGTKKLGSKVVSRLARSVLSPRNMRQIGANGLGKQAVGRVATGSVVGSTGAGASLAEVRNEAYHQVPYRSRSPYELLQFDADTDVTSRVYMGQGILEDIKIAGKSGFFGAMLPILGAGAIFSQLKKFQQVQKWVGILKKGGVAFRIGKVTLAGVALYYLYKWALEYFEKDHIEDTVLELETAYEETRLSFENASEEDRYLEGSRHKTAAIQMASYYALPFMTSMELVMTEYRRSAVCTVFASGKMNSQDLNEMSHEMWQAVQGLRERFSSRTERGLHILRETFDRFTQKDRFYMIDNVGAVGTMARLFNHYKSSDRFVEKHIKGTKELARITAEHAQFVRQFYKDYVNPFTQDRLTIEDKKRFVESWELLRNHVADYNAYNCAGKLPGSDLLPHIKQSVADQ